MIILNNWHNLKIPNEESAKSIALVSCSHSWESNEITGFDKIILITTLFQITNNK